MSATSRGLICIDGSCRIPGRVRIYRIIVGGGHSMTARTHPRPMLLVLAVRWIAVVWMATMALVGGQVLAERAWVTVLSLAGTLAWTAWLTLAAAHRVIPVLLVDLLVAVALVLVSG